MNQPLRQPIEVHEGITIFQYTRGPLLGYFSAPGYWRATKCLDLLKFTLSDLLHRNNITIRDGSICLTENAIAHA